MLIVWWNSIRFTNKSLSVFSVINCALYKFGALKQNRILLLLQRIRHILKFALLQKYFVWQVNEVNNMTVHTETLNTMRKQIISHLSICCYTLSD